MSQDKRIVARREEREKIFNESKLEGEIWKDMKGYENQYMISNLGRVYSKIRRGGGGCFKKHGLSTTGYKMHHLDNYDNGKSIYLHRLLGENFIDNPENKPCIDHINRDRMDNRLENLRWVTYSENNYNRDAKGCISINKTTINNKTYEYYRVRIRDKNIGSFKTREDAETALNSYTNQST